MCLRIDYLFIEFETKKWKIKLIYFKFTFKILQPLSEREPTGKSQDHAIMQVSHFKFPPFFLGGGTNENLFAKRNQQQPLWVNQRDPRGNQETMPI